MAWSTLELSKRTEAGPLSVGWLVSRWCHNRRATCRELQIRVNILLFSLGKCLCKYWFLSYLVSCDTTTTTPTTITEKHFWTSGRQQLTTEGIFSVRTPFHNFPNWRRGEACEAGSWFKQSEVLTDLHSPTCCWSMCSLWTISWASSECGSLSNQRSEIGM